MTIAALMLAPEVFRQHIPEPLKCCGLGVLFVNVPIGGTLTSYAALPVLMVAATWQWDSAFMFCQFGWNAAVAVLINATIATLFLRKLCANTFNRIPWVTNRKEAAVPVTVVLIDLVLLAGVVRLALHAVPFLGLFLMSLGDTNAYGRHQSPLILKKALLVAFFLAGPVVLGGLQGWLLTTIVSSLEPLPLFFGAPGLTAVTDNAALTYLGSLIVGISEESKYMLKAGAVAGGGLTVIANEPNPAGVALLKNGFKDETIAAGGLPLGAVGPTTLAAAALLLLSLKHSEPVLRNFCLRS